MIMRVARQLAILALATILTFALLLATGRIELSPRFNPFLPLDPLEDPGLFTGLKFARARADPTLCRAAVERGGLRLDPVPDRVTGEGCGFENALRIARIGQATLSSPVVVSCPVALGLVMFERHGLAPAARRHLGSRVLRIEHMGAYSCRNINHATSGRRSRHATANAIDIGGFGLAEGRRLTLAGDWTSLDQARSGFLYATRDAACRWFDVVLSPAYNALHADHFHFDMGGGRACR
jgi:hypothetical protein